MKKSNAEKMEEIKHCKYRTMLRAEFDLELNALNASTAILEQLSFDQQWRVLNYILTRLWGRAWMLSRPLTDQPVERQAPARSAETALVHGAIRARGV